MNIKHLFILLTSILLLWPAPIRAEQRDSVIVSLLTCWPGREVYELCGHEAIRVRSASGMGVDSVWNYGVFDFSRPNFIYRFVKGETDYMLASYPFSYFFTEYAAAGRRVVEQDLNLTPQEAARLHAMLKREALPENCTYRYNYVKDNCATRILDRLDTALSPEYAIYGDSIRYGTFRNEMRAYHGNYPWYQFGIDMALGSGIDSDIDSRGEMFVPIEMMKNVERGRISDGRPLVSDTRVLIEGTEYATSGPTPFLFSPMMAALMVLAIAVVVCIIQWCNQKIYRWVYSIWFGITGIAGCLVTFLVCVSTHEATSPNMMLIWLNPLELLIAFGVWAQHRLRRIGTTIAWLETAALVVMLTVWPFQAQSANVAFFPLILATLILSGCYAIIDSKKSYK